jgi:hypothetical protein
MVGQSQVVLGHGNLVCRGSEIEKRLPHFDFDPGAQIG